MFLSTKGKSSKKIVKDKKAKTETVKTAKETTKKTSVTVTEVAEVTEPLEVLETEIEAPKAPEVSAEEIMEELRELKPKEGKKIVIGTPRLTRFERARIIGARALQLSLEAPPLIPLQEGVTDSIGMADAELNAKALPISLRRILPNGQYQDIPIKWLLEN